MRLICISRGSYSGGKDLAQRLAEKLGWSCLSREELLDEAASQGIAVGKLEMAMIKPRPLTERMALERDHYQAFVTSALCERSLKENLIYHGRTAHLLLPSVHHVLRIRVVSDMEFRIGAVMQRLNLSREKAKEYVEKVEEDRKRWVRSFYNVDWSSSSLYDVVVNLERMNLDNAAASLCTVAQLPDFQATPACDRAMEDLLLASRARLAIARDERTWETQVKTSAEKGVVSVTYLPGQAKSAAHIPDLLKNLEGMRQLICTMAGTNILWIQEQFSPNSTGFHPLIEVADKWRAAVEMIRLIPIEEDRESEIEKPEVDERLAATARARPRRYEGGIEDDAETETVEEDEGVQRTLEELIRHGRSGGIRTVRGTPRRLLNSINRSVHYSLIVIGDVFLEKGRSAQVRLARELGAFLSEQLRVPAVMSNELQTQFLFERKHVIQLFLFLICTVFLYTLVFANQEMILRFMSSQIFWIRILRAAALVVFIPVVAYVYGTTAHLVLKLLKFE